MHPSLSKRIARVATALEGLDKPKMPKRALAEGKGDKLPTEINLDKATPKRIAPIVNNVDGRLKNIDKYTDALVTALEAKKEDKVKSVMKSLKTQIDALHKWLMQDVTRLVTASSKASYRQGEATIKRARTAYAKANQFLAAVKNRVARVPKRAGPGAAVTFSLSGESSKFRAQNPSFDGKASIPASAINAALTSGKDINLKCNIDVIDVSVSSYYDSRSAHDAGVITNLRIEAASLKEDLNHNLAKEYDAESDDASTATVYSAEDFVYSHGWVRASAPTTIEFNCQLGLSGDRLDGDVQAIATMTLNDELTYAYEDLDSFEDDEDEI